MTDQKIYADNFRCTFDDPGDFIQFLKERKENSRWMTAPSLTQPFEAVLTGVTTMGKINSWIVGALLLSSGCAFCASMGEVFGQNDLKTAWGNASIARNADGSIRIRQHAG